MCTFSINLHKENTRTHIHTRTCYIIHYFSSWIPESDPLNSITCFNILTYYPMQHRYIWFISFSFYLFSLVFIFLFFFFGIFYFPFFCFLRTRTPFPNQHGSGGRIRPPLLPLHNLPNYQRPSIPHQPVINQPSSSTVDSKTTKLQPSEGGKTAREENREKLPKYSQDLIDSNEIEAATLSSKVAPEEALPSHEITMTLIPITAVCALVLGLGMGAWSLRSKICGSKKSKEDTVNWYFV